MSNQIALNEIAKQPHFSHIVDAVHNFYTEHDGLRLTSKLTVPIEQIVFEAAPLISHTTGLPISYTDLRALQVSEVLNAVIVNNDNAASWNVRDIVNEWIRKDFEDYCVNGLSRALWSQNSDPKLAEALRALNVRSDMVYSDLQDLEIVDALLSTPRSIVDAWAEGRSVYSLYVAETDAGFLTIGDKEGYPGTCIEPVFNGSSKTWSMSFDAHWDLLFQYDEVDLSGFFPSSNSKPSVSASVTTVALVEDECWLGYCECLVMSLKSEAVPSNQLVREVLYHLCAYGAAEPLTRLYGSPLLFQSGAFILLLNCEIASDHRGGGVGLRLVERSLKELKQIHPDIRTIAWPPEPMQHHRGSFHERRPPSIESEYRHSKEKLTEYCLLHEPRIESLLSDIKGQAKSLIYRDDHFADIFEIFKVSEELVRPSKPNLH